jgi:hypothetical protein
MVVCVTVLQRYKIIIFEAIIIENPIKRNVKPCNFISLRPKEKDWWGQEFWKVALVTHLHRTR